MFHVPKKKSLKSNARQYIQYEMIPLHPSDSPHPWPAVHHAYYEAIWTLKSPVILIRKNWHYLAQQSVVYQPFVSS